MAEFSPSRLILARERRGLLAKELAARCGVTPQSVSYWEAGKNPPLPETLRAIAEELRFPEAFFFRPDLDRLPEKAANFRARTKMPARQKRAALAAGDLAAELARWIEAKFELPLVRLPDLSGQGPCLAAQIVRAEWLLAERPIPNTIHLLESRGVLVFSLAQDCRELDAFSFWAGHRPVVLLNTMKSAERSRMDALHELFHLLAHKEETGKEEEHDADAFAGAMLMAEHDVRRHVPRALGLSHLVAAKQRWGASLPALVFRLHELEILSDWQYRSLYLELSKRGFRTAEPNPMPRETSSLLAKVFEQLRNQGISANRVAAELAWPLEQIQELLLGLGATVLGLDGSGPGGRKGSRSNLRLV